MKAFEYREVSPGKWLVENLPLAYQFWLYGTRREVRETVARHERAHAARLGKKAHGAAWRDRISAQMVDDAKKRDGWK